MINKVLVELNRFYYLSLKLSEQFNKNFADS